MFAQESIAFEEFWKEEEGVGDERKRILATALLHQADFLFKDTVLSNDGSAQWHVWMFSLQKTWIPFYRCRCRGRGYELAELGTVT